MDIDFEKITELNKEIEELLKERPEMREWWNDVQLQMSKVCSKNRFALAQHLMFVKFREMNEKLQEVVNNLEG